MTPSQKVLLLALAFYANDAGECTAPIEKLAHWSRASERTTKANLKVLEKQGSIQAIATGGYRVLPTS